jgi:hypothetical protein
MNASGERAGKSTGDLSPFGPAGGTFAARRAVTAAISRRTDGSACRGPRERPGLPGSGSKRTVIWGIPVNPAFRELIIAYLASLPKSPKIAMVLNQMANEGMGPQTLLEFAPKQLQQFSALRDLYQRYRHLLDPTRERVNANYRPPRVALPQGWAWADHRTFGQLRGYTPL